MKHSICEKCWERRYSDRRPVTLKEEYRQQERCCFCGKDHKSGIYIWLVEYLLCQGQHQ